MFARVFTVSLFALMLLCTTVFAGANFSGKWHASAMGARIEATVEQHGDSVEGVAYVHSPVGRKKDTFHFKGNVSGATINAAHYRGHRFVGTLQTPNKINGVITTREGQSMPVQLTRR